MASENLIAIIKRQTDYTEDVIIGKLKEYNNDIEKIILEYNNVDNGVDNFSDNNSSTNQKIFKAIRENFDNIRRPGLP